MSWWLTPAEMTACDRRAAASGTPEEELMERAGQAAFDLASRMASREAGPVDIYCGPGNNGGDGFVLARLMKEHGFTTRAVLAADSASSISPLCMKNLVRFRESGGTVIGLNRLSEMAGRPALSVDALLGTGFRGSLGGSIQVCCLALAGAKGRVLALDTPTGIDGATGAVDPLTPPADVTVCFAAAKAGVLLPPGCGRAGAVFVAEIGIPVDERPDRMLLDFGAAARLLPERPVDAHKNIFGKLMLMCGSEDMPGAAILTAHGAIRAGVGLAHLFVPYPAAPAVSGRVPEAICSYFLPGDVSSLPDPSGYMCLAAGPGMGAGVDTAKIIRHIVGNWDIPLVLDADGLNVIAGAITGLAARRGPLILTPHPGELERLTGKSDTGLPDRWDTASALSRATGAVILLKGRPSMAFSPDGRRMLIPTGNHGLATGGSGDILTGIVGALFCQGLDCFDSAALGAFVHGLAADIAAAGGSARSIIPSEVADTLGRAYAFLEDGPPEGLLRLEGRWNGRLWNLP